MSIKSLLLLLFLYVCLVWVGAAILKEGPQIREFGLLWTAVGLIAVLAWVVIAWLWGWFRIARARAAAKPKTPAKGPVAVALHEDDAALLALIGEAKVALAKATTASAQRIRLQDLPLYLLVGPENSGKTSTFLNSGLEPVALSGQTGGGQAIPTRLANIWLARNALFVELGGRAFSGDLGRWASLLRALRGGSAVPMWRRLLKEADDGLSLRGIVAFCDVKEFTAAASPQGREKLDRLSSLWRDRLGAITEVFGRHFPVYLITSKTDAVPHFADYFGRMHDPDLSQIFGCSLPLTAGGGTNAEAVSADAENKRLTKTFSPLLHRLAERRIIHLAHENDESRRPGIYEFPRELRRIRPTLVQFMVDVFRPHPLRHTPFLRGYYFTGTCEEEIAGGPSRNPKVDDISVSDVTGVFQGDATQVFQNLEAAKAAQKPAGRANVTRRWAFVSELFTSVVLQDNAVPRTIAPVAGQRIDLYRKAACGAVCALCALLCGCFIWSWVGNSRLLESVNTGGRGLVRGQRPTLADLQSLDELRQQATRLLDYDRNGPPWRLRWGLYAGGALAKPARDVYFQRFQEMLLNDLNGTITNHLKAVPASAGTGEANYDAVSKLLKAHLMISSGSCKPDPAFVTRALKQTLDETAAGSNYDWRLLADRQIEFYAGELPAGNPVRLVEDKAAVERARGYLRSIQGAERIYAALLSEAEKRFPNPQRLSTIAANYTQVLSGMGEVSGVFTPEGWNYVKNAAKNARSNTSGDSCVEETNFVGGIQQNLELERALQRLFVRDYIDRWQRFVKSFSVLRYNGAADAERKLDVLADHKSPLLAVLALASKNTYFTAPPPSAIDKPKKAIIDILGKAKDAVSGQTDTNLPDVKAPEGQTEIMNAFQPVQWVVPAASETWVTDKNNAYVDALAQLGHSMQEISRGGELDPAILQTASQNYDKAIAAARQLEQRLAPNSNGLDVSVQRLLEEPIVQTQRLIPTPANPVEKINAAARGFCGRISGTLHKYPFQPSTVDTQINELAQLFAPASGLVWKFQADTLADLVVKDGAHWKAKEGGKATITSGMLNFLNRAQAVTDAFFPNGANQPQLLYTLRPKLDPAYKDAFIELELDGVTHQWKTSLQKQFVWPASPAASKVGAVGRVVTGSLSFPFASRGGLWGIFRVMGDAEPRSISSKIVEWKYLHGGNGQSEPITPAPVRLEIVEFPGGADVFNPKFYEGLQCSGKAAQ